LNPLVAHPYGSLSIKHISINFLQPVIRTHKDSSIAALIGAFTLHFHLNARRGHTARTFATTLKSGTHSPCLLYRLPLPREEGDAGATRRASATRSHEPSRGTKRVLDFSLSRLTSALTSRSQEGQLLPPPPRSPPPPAAHAPFSPSPAALFSSGPRALSRKARPDRRPLAHSNEFSRAFSRACMGHAHEGTSRPRVPTCGEGRGRS